MLKSALSKRESGESNGKDKKALHERVSLRGNAFGAISFQKFKPPNRAEEASRSGRKRKHVNYSNMGGGEDASGDADAGSDSEKENGASTKKRKRVKGSNVVQVDASYMRNVNPDGSSKHVTKHVFRDFGSKHKKESSERNKMSSIFSIPKRISADGTLVALEPSFRSLGSRFLFEVPPRPLHDPMGDCAIVLFDPTVDDIEAQREKDRLQKLQEEAEIRLTQQEEKQDETTETQSSKTSSAGSYQSVHKSLAEILNIRKKNPNDTPPKVPVVIDPRLAKILRPHQVEGVKFLYRCSTGLVQENAFGSIMADGMGLGKTLQCIALMWTLLKQSPIPRKPSIEKCIIACPSTLVRNWANELKKWLQEKEPGSLVIDGSQQKDAMIDSVRRWCDTRGRNVTQPVMIVSYETLRNIASVLGEAEVGLLLCDEGHRLKNADSLTFKALDSIKVKRRIILSGTPIQNDLTEYFALLNFTNPDLLGDVKARRNFETAILRGRDSDATEKEIEEGDAKLRELTSLVSKFIIRRSNELNKKYLPVKYEHVVFCHLSNFQKDVYRYFLKSDDIKGLLKGKNSQPLKAINVLKKLCNHPDLVDFAKDLEGAEGCFPDGYRPGIGRHVDYSLSGKMAVLERFLTTIRQTSKDKVVLISNYTQTLDIFDRMCRHNNWGSFRLDGSMSIKKRQKYVDQFNDPERNEFIFLLSSKAGGCGINLIGANRLVLFDPDWNPASDQQALARVWREGQTKECFVYRFISTGSIEEKILQRQLSKQALSKCVVDEAEDQERQFSLNDLRELFRFKEDTCSETHDTIKCKRCKDGKQLTRAPAMLNEDCSTWNHYSREEFKGLHDDLLRAEIQHDAVSFVFQFCSI